MPRHPLTILLAPNPEWGGVTSTIPLAKALRNFGHRAIYVGPPMCDFFRDVAGIAWDRAIAHIENAGFEYFPIVKRLSAIPARRGVSGVHIIHAIFTEAIEDVEQLITTQNIDVALVDAFVWFLAIASARQRIPTVSVKTNLRGILNWDIPPCTSSLVPRATFGSRLKIGVEWARVWSFWRIAVPLSRSDIPLRALVGDITRAGRAAGLKTVLSDFLPEFDLPEIVLCPRAFDFPQTRQRRYFGCVDNPCSTDDFNWPEASSDARRLYFTLGTLTSEFLPDARRCASVCLQAIAARHDLSMLMQVSNPAVYKDLTIPLNVHLHDWLPQAAALKYADVAVIAGGLGTVKECISAGVPMLVIAPSHADKPGNAARVEYHNIGYQLSARSTSPLQVTRSIDTLLDRRDEFRRNMSAIQSELSDHVPLRDFVAYIESLGTTSLAVQ